MTSIRTAGNSVRCALSRARTAILTLAFTYAVSVLLGIVMVHTGNGWALSYRDRLVARAGARDPAARALREGHRLRAALLDFGRNLLLGAVPNTVGGTAIVLPYPLAAYRGWVGGIVSVDRHHRSRFRDARRAAYYVLALIFQLIPYSLAGGAGVYLGLAYLRARSGHKGALWLGFPHEAVRDVLRIYALVVSLFLFASLWEFLSPWNS